MKLSNLKDFITTICGIIILAAGIIHTVVLSGVTVAPTIVNIFTTAGIVAAAVLAYFTGKNPDGSTKTTEQITAQQKPAETIAKAIGEAK
jgi:hypothetical protein